MQRPLKSLSRSKILQRIGLDTDRSHSSLNHCSRSDVVTDVAFELFNLGPNSTLIVNNLTSGLDCV
jgi:hypothetical protein